MLFSFHSFFCRYFFEKPAHKCDVHQRNLAKSLNELYTDPAPRTLFSFDLPHEFPLTRSVSTTTDIFSNCSGGFGGNSASQRSFKTLTPQPNKRTTVTLHTSSFGDTNDDDNRSISKSLSRDSLNDMYFNNTNNNGNQTKGILLKRNKSKDELFNEFCKKAGQRPKPKDIYYIEQSSYDDQIPDSIFVVENYATIRKNRRHSTSNIRKISNLSASNQSLKDSNLSNGRKTIPMKNIFDANTFGGSTETGATFLSNNHIDNNNYFSQNRSNSRDSNLYQSRTLPRDFLKQSGDFSFDDDPLAGRRVSVNGLYTPYDNNIAMNVPIAAPKQFSSNDDDNENFYNKNVHPLNTQNNQQRDIYNGPDDMLTVQWPNAIPGSPSTFSNRSQFQGNFNQIYSPCIQSNMQRRSSFYSQHYPHPLRKQQAINSISNGGSTSDNEDVTNTNNSSYTNGRTDDADGGSASSGNSDEFGMFDLDRMEKERRKSHASLFEVDQIDFMNGTPV